MSQDVGGLPAIVAIFVDAPGPVQVAAWRTHRVLRAKPRVTFLAAHDGSPSERGGLRRRLRRGLRQ